jgi:hypothetical protein
MYMLRLLSSQRSATTIVTRHCPPQTRISHAEPPWSGWIANAGDALIMLEVARGGAIHCARLVDAEHKMICSGSLFVVDENKSWIKSWTYGLY